jgi:hypothetical protein
MTPERRDPADIASRKSRLSLRLRYLLHTKTYWIIQILAAVVLGITLGIVMTSGPPAPKPVTYTSLANGNDLYYTCQVNMPNMNDGQQESVTIYAYSSAAARGYIDTVTVGGVVADTGNIDQQTVTVDEEVTVPANQSVTVGTYPISDTALEYANTTCLKVIVGE